MLYPDRIAYQNQDPAMSSASAPGFASPVPRPLPRPGPMPGQFPMPDPVPSAGAQATTLRQPGPKKLAQHQKFLERHGLKRGLPPQRTAPPPAPHPWDPGDVRY